MPWTTGVISSTSQAEDSGGLGGHGIGDTQSGGQDEDDGPANILGEQLDGRHALLQY